MSAACWNLDHEACAGCDCVCHLDRQAYALAVYVADTHEQVPF